MDQYYVDSSYWDDFYAGYQAQAQIGIEPYYVEGYTDAGYYEPGGGSFTLSAELSQNLLVNADAGLSATHSMTVAAGVIKSADSALTVNVTQTAIISHIEGADLFAMSDAALAAQVSRLRDNNITASSAFNIATDATRTRNLSSEDSANFTVDIANLRVRYNEAAIDAAFSLTADNSRVRYNDSAVSAEFTLTGQIEVVPGGIVHQGEAALTSESNLSLDISRLLESTADISSSIELTAELSKIRSLSGQLSSQTTATADAVIVASAQLSLESNAQQQTTALKIISFEISAGGLFTPAISVEAITNTFAVLDSVSQLQIEYNAIRRTSIATNVSTAMATVAVKKTNAQATIASTAGQTASVSRTTRTSIALTATSSLQLISVDLDLAQAALASTFSLTATGKQVKGARATLASQFTFNITADFSSLGLLYKAGSLSGYITSGRAQIYDQISGDSGGFHPVWTNFWFRTGQQLPLGDIQFIYVSGSDTIPAGWGWPNNHYSNHRNWILISRAANGSYTLEIKTSVKRVSPVNVEPNPSGNYDFRHTNYRTTITLPANFDPTKWHNFHIPMSLGVWMIPPSGSFSSYNVYTPSIPAVDGVGVPYSIGLYDDQLYLDADPYEDPSLFVPTDGGRWGAANNTIDLYIDNIWVKSNGTGPDRSQYTTFPISQFYDTTTGTPRAISTTGVNAAGVQAQVWLPFSDLNDKSSLSPTWNYTRFNSVLVGMAIGFDADLTTQFSVTAGPTKLIRRSAALSSTTSLNITGLRIKRSAVAVNTQFTANISGQKNVILGSTQTAVSSVTASLSRTKRFTSSLSAQATMAVTAKKIVRGITAMASASSLTADAKRLRGITSATASESQLTGQVIKTARANSTINAWVTEISVVNKIGRGLIGFDATTTMTVDAVKLTDIPIFLAANTDITAIGNNILYGDADLLAFTEQNSNVDYLRRNESNMTVSASMEAVNGRVRYNSAEFNVVTNSIVSTLFSRTRRFASVQTNTVNLVTNNQIVKLASATMSSQFTLLTIAGSVTRFTINMVVTGFQLSAGRIIHIDEYYQLAIPAETRFLKIIPESRLLEVNQETRVNKITGR